MSDRPGGLPVIAAAARPTRRTGVKAKLLTPPPYGVHDDRGHADTTPNSVITSISVPRKNWIATSRPRSTQ